MKLYRGAKTKTRNNHKNWGISLKPIASRSACTHFVGDVKVINLLRPNLPVSSSVLADVSSKGKTGGSKERRTKKLVTLDCGIVSFKPLPNAKGKSTMVQGKRDSFFISNLCDVVYEAGDRVVQVQARTDGFKAEKDEHGHRQNQNLVTYFIGFDAAAQARVFAFNIVIEADNFGTVVDLGLGWLEENNKKENMGSHLECLLRKRVDLYSISKPRGSDVLGFAMDELSLYLKKKGEEDESTMWEDLSIQRSEESPTDSKNRGLKEIQEDYQKSLKENNFKLLEQKLGMLFAQDQEHPTSNSSKLSERNRKQMNSSFYASLFTSGRFEDVD